ncbi:MAG: tRNA glutamyl-Q(34) synthetase GluQRS [Trueperaceae bacterium]
MSRGRFAPSPTGSLHLGNARTALVAWLRARTAGSSFVMRVEDLDEPRTVPEAVTGNLDELRWLGLDWDEGPDIGGPYAPYQQSQRHDLYAQALPRLQEHGRVFECFLSRRELRELSSAPHGAGPVYGERERQKNERVAERKRTEGKVPSLRLRVAPGQVGFDDLLLGRQLFDAEHDVGDIVLRRADHAWAYQFAVVVDDAAMDIREVVRGADLLPSTAAQLLIYRSLGLEAPAFLHVPLLLDRDGERMAKRRGSLTLAALRDNGVDRRRVVGLLAYTLGMLPEPEVLEPTDLLAFGRPADGPERFRRHDFRLEPQDLAWLAR